MSDGYLIGGDLLGKIYDHVDGGGTTRNGLRSGGGDRQHTYVKCTSSTASSGWYPGVVRTHASTGDIDHTQVVEIKDSNAAALVSGKVYLAVRTGPKSDGTPRYICTVGGGAPTTTNKVVVTGVSCVGGNLSVTTEIIKVIP